MTQSHWKERYPRLKALHLDFEAGGMKERYPQFRLVDDGRYLSFRGPMKTNYGGLYQVEIRLPHSFPDKEPTFWVLSPKLPENTQHRYAPGNLCAHADPYVPYQTTIASLVSVVAGWLFRFERHHFHKVPWNDPIEPPGKRLAVDPDGRLYIQNAR